MSEDLQKVILQLRSQLEEKDKEIALLKSEVCDQTECQSLVPLCEEEMRHLTNPMIARYSRQLILPEVGVPGQIRLSSSRVLIVGAGGLGCPAAIYLDAAGVGVIGIVDYDEVEVSNLHRQILHTEQRVGLFKAHSAATSCRRLNSLTRCVPHVVALNSANALDLIRQYDVVLDASDNVATRYLLNDACILAGKPLVSGSALRWEGQLTVYNHAGGPCYRCLFPEPPPADTVTNCSDGGVVGVVPGIIGSLQALEAIKIILKQGDVMSGRLLLFDGLACRFRNVNLRSRKSTCAICGETPTIRELIDYEQFCGAKATDKDAARTLLDPSDRLSVKDYECMVKGGRQYALVDVRQPVEMDICRLPASSSSMFYNIPMSEIKSSVNDVFKDLYRHVEERNVDTVCVVCRRGNDSQLATQALRRYLLQAGSSVTVKDISGGLTAWARQIDPDFPVY